MTDINRRLQHNSVSQKQAKQAAEYLELDRQGKEIEERVQVSQGRPAACTKLSYPQQNKGNIRQGTPTIVPLALTARCRLKRVNQSD